MSPLKKGELLEKETVETVEEVILFKVNPRLKSGVNKKLPVIITVSTCPNVSVRWAVSEFLVLCKIQFKLQPFLSKLFNYFKYLIIRTFNFIQNMQPFTVFSKELPWRKLEI